MRAITVRQPWAWAIIHGGKDVENRTRNIAGAYRGPVAIHAALDWNKGAFDDPVMGPILRDHWRLTRGNYTGADLGGTGVVLGVVDLRKVHDSDACWRIAVLRAGVSEPRPCSPWAMDGHHHLILANPRPLATPVPAKGRLGLWTLPDDVEAAVLEHLAAA